MQILYNAVSPLDRNEFCTIWAPICIGLPVWQACLPQCEITRFLGTYSFSEGTNGYFH